MARRARPSGSGCSARMAEATREATRERAAWRRACASSASSGVAARRGEACLGDVVGIEITINNDFNDEDTTNNQWTNFLQIKFVIFSDGFENGLSNWDTSYEKFGGDNIWALDSSKQNAGSNSLYSGKKSLQSYPGVTGASTAALDLSLPVDATLSFSHNYRFYYNYDGAIVEISTNGGTTWDEIAPSDRGDGLACLHEQHREPASPRGIGDQGLGPDGTRADPVEARTAGRIRGPPRHRVPF